jgi:hypothetical protein
VIRCGGKRGRVTHPREPWEDYGAQGAYGRGHGVAEEAASIQAAQEADEAGAGRGTLRCCGAR